jgi:hypothetical protein
VGSLNDYQKEQQFRVLNQKKEERGVKVIRDGVEHIIDIKASAYSFPISYPSASFLSYHFWSSLFCFRKS